MSNDLTTIIQAVQSRPPDFHSNVVKNCTLNSPTLIFQFLQYSLSLIQHDENAEIPEISREYALHDCFSVINEYFNLSISKDDEIYSVLDDQDNVLGYFKIVDADGCWFDIEEPINQLPNGSVHLCKDAGYMTWHEMGHCIHHILRDLDIVSPDLWEFGGVLFERLAAQFYQFDLPTYPQLKEIALSLLDLELSLCTSITEQELIKLVEHIQNYVGVDITINDLEPIIGQYGGCYFTYPWGRFIVG
jgi:hypothetical protein